MRSNSIWFDSPLPKLTSIHPPPHQELEIDQEESNFAKSPEDIPPIKFHSHSQMHPLSPWSSLINPDNDPKSSHLSLPGLFPVQQEKAIDEKLIYSQEEDQDLVTPIRNQQNCGESQEEGEQHTTGKKSQSEPGKKIKKPRPRDKGLRKLSQKAFQIVRDMRNVSYKEVAGRLMQELNEEDFDGENKEEQNIKRRVYDALNVLIALGVLKKDGRKIVSQKDYKTVTIDLMGSQEIEKLKQKIALKETVLAQKQRQLRQVEDKFDSITSLLKRNRSATHGREFKISFPFIGIMVDEGEEEQTEQTSEEEVWVRTGQPVQPFGDIDSLKWLQQFSPPIDSYIGQVSSFL